MKIKLAVLSTFTVATLALSACGGSSSGAVDTVNPPAAAAVTTVGKVTGFGSVYVNGVKFDTSSASYRVDDSDVFGDADLSVGMVVKIAGTVNADGKNGTADSVDYDDDVEGPVENLAGDANEKTFTVFGVSIVADSRSTKFEAEDDSAFSFETLADGDNVEVSGEYYGDVLLASYIEKQDAADDDYEVEGTIADFAGGDTFTFTLVLAGGDTLMVTLDPAAELPSGGLEDGQYVEVEGTMDPSGAPDSIVAMRVELEDDDYFDEEDGDVEIKGVLSRDVDTDSWSINGMAVMFDDNTVYEPESLGAAIADGSADGTTVEVEGSYVDGVLIAEKVESEDDDIEFTAVVESTSPDAEDSRNGTVVVNFGAAMGTLTVIIDAGTLMLDDEVATPFDLTQLMAGDMVEVEGHQDADGNIVASSLHMEDDSEIEIEGPLEAISDTSITVLTIEFGTDENTMFEQGTPEVGTYVSVEDNDGDGIADEVEIDD